MLTLSIAVCAFPMINWTEVMVNPGKKLPSGNTTKKPWGAITVLEGISKGGLFSCGAFMIRLDELRATGWFCELYSSIHASFVEGDRSAQFQAVFGVVSTSLMKSVPGTVGAGAGVPETGDGTADTQLGAGAMVAWA
jgi:hypothetical protein